MIGAFLIMQVELQFLKILQQEISVVSLTDIIRLSNRCIAENSATQLKISPK